MCLPCVWQVPYVNTINEWAEPNSALGLTANTVIDSNDSPPGEALNLAPALYLKVLDIRPVFLR